MRTPFYHNQLHVIASKRGSEAIPSCALGYAPYRWYMLGLAEFVETPGAKLTCRKCISSR